MTRDADWTDADLALLQSLDAAGTPLTMIARRLGREEAAIEDKLPIARARKHPLPIPQAQPEPSEEWFGPDEEGDVTPPVESSDDPAAWVHPSAKQ